MKNLIITLISILLFVSHSPAQQKDSIARHPAAVVLSGDTLLHIYSGIGTFSAQQRAETISLRLKEIVEKNIHPSLIRTEEANGYRLISIAGIDIMAVTDNDAVINGRQPEVLTEEYVRIMRIAIMKAEQVYSMQNILLSIGTVAVLLTAAIFLFWGMRRIFPRWYAAVERWEKNFLKPFTLRSHELISEETISLFLVVLSKGIRLAVSLAVVYLFSTYSLSLLPWTKHWNIGPVLTGIFLTLFSTIALAAGFKLLNALFASVIGKIRSWKGTLIKPVKLKSVELLSEERLAELFEGGFKSVRLLFLAVFVYFYLTVIFTLFEFTQSWSSILLGYITKPVWNVINAVITYIPNLFFIVVIGYAARLIIKFTRLLFSEIQKGNLTVTGFNADWGEPTYKIIRFLIVAFAAVIIFPYLPGSETAAFEGISVFLGVLISLGSSSAVSNIVAGIVLTYMSPFKIGDRVKIADTVGDITAKTLFVTHVRTIKNVDISIPNAIVLGNHIVNFSTSAANRGLILHTTVTIGYDVPWKKVHELLNAAAAATENILSEPKPYVLQTSLDDFYVSYELNAYTDKPNAMAATYSMLHQNIQDAFNRAGVEITSPHFAAVRDGNKTTIPDDYLPRDYQTPGFRVFHFNNK